MESLANQLRVLCVIPGDPEGPSMIFCKREVDEIKREGVEIIPFFLASRVSPKMLIKEWRRFRRIVRVFRPHVVHSNYGTMTGFFSAVSTSLPLVVTFRGTDLNPTSSISWVRSFFGRALSQLAALRAQQIICVSSELKNRLWWRKSRVVVIPSGVDTRLFFPVSHEKARIEMGWELDERVVLFNAGKADMPILKRLDLAEMAVNFAQSKCGRIRFVVLRGDVEGDLIPIMMNASNCLLVTSDSEGSPTVVQEAMACNLPVVSVDVGDVRERLDGVQPSYIVNQDPEEIGRYLKKILMAKERSNGNSAIQDISVQNLAKKIVSIYMRVRKLT